VTVTISHGLVASPHPTASEAGLRILRAGGNAVDAAVAAAYALCVCTPASTGVAGYGGCLILHAAAMGAPVGIDYTGVAPRAARADMYDVERGPGGAFTAKGAANVFGARAVDVPGVVAGLSFAHARYGSLPYDDVLAPAIEAAVEGFPVDRWLAEKYEEVIAPRAGAFPDAAALYRVDGRPPREGDRLANPALGPVLERIARDGSRGFYEGEIARAIVDTVRRAGGDLALDDLAAYRVADASIASASFAGCALYTPDLPTGGITVLQMLRILEALPPIAPGDDAELAHVAAEILKVCWRERLLRYADPRFVPIAPEAVLGDRTIEALAARVRAGLASPEPGELIAPDPVVGTVHVCAADAAGNVVSLTQTHGGSFGSLVAVPGTGILLGHGMSRFEPRPGWPNSIAPGKRPLHNMSPMLALRDGKPFFCVGGAGGRTIQANLFHVITRAAAWGQPLAAAIDAPRFHVETAEPIVVETGGETLVEGLLRRGHQARLRSRFGSLQAIAFQNATEMTGIADARRAGTILWA
jgi:gamma-glutamyltranspeptidase/glutathione hydrolase